MELKIGERVRKTKGYPFPGTYRGSVNTEKGYKRLIVEHDDGWLHIFNPEQVEADRLSPPEPEQPDLAEIMWAGAFSRWDTAKRSWGRGNGWQEAISYLRTALSELIASKDAEIERLKGEADEGEKLAEQYRNIAEDIESERSALRAENATLRQSLAIQEGISDTVHEALWEADKAAERKPAEPNDNQCTPSRAVEDVAVERASDTGVARALADRVGTSAEPDHWMLVQPGNTAPVVEVTQGDIDAADTWVDAYENDMVLLNSASIARALARHRTEAEARGRREALEEAIAKIGPMKTGRSQPIVMTCAEIIDELKRLMTEVK